MRVSRFPSWLKKDISRGKDYITSVNDQVGKDIDFFELQGLFIEGFQEGLEIELRKGELNHQEHQLKERYLKERYLNPEWNFRMPDPIRRLA